MLPGMSTDRRGHIPGANVARTLVPTVLFAALLLVARRAAAEPRMMPPDGTRVLPGQRFDVRVEGLSPEAQGSVRLTVDGAPPTAKPEVVVHGEGEAAHVDVVVRGLHLEKPGPHRLRLIVGGGPTVEQTVIVDALTPPPGVRGARNVILILGDGMGLAHRTGARVLARGYTAGRARAPLAMDTMDATGLVMTSSLNALITDSAPGMSAYTTGSKANNNQLGVFPDDTVEPFDNPRIEYLGSWLRRRRGDGFNVGIVTTADVTDATPAACAVHTADRRAGAGIARLLFDERADNGATVVLGGGRKHFEPRARGGGQPERDLLAEFAAAGYARADTATALVTAAGDRAVTKVLGLFHPDHMTASFDKVGLGAGYSDELRGDGRAVLRDQPALRQMTRAALEVLGRSSPRGFFLMVEGASIDKRSHEQDAERALWDVIELDNAVAEALAYARRTNGNADPGDDTLVIVTADHETGGMGLVAVGNERYAPATLGKAVRDYAATLRFDVQQLLSLFPNYQQDADGFPVDPDPTRKLIVGWAAGGDRYENYLSNRLAQSATKLLTTPAAASGGKAGPAAAPAVPVTVRAVANPERDGPTSGPDVDNTAVGGRAIPGFLVPGIIENGAERDPRAPGDTSSVPITVANHTASDVPLSASGPGALTFTGTYDNTDTFFRMARILGAWRGKAPRTTPAATPSR